MRERQGAVANPSTSALAGAKPAGLGLADVEQVVEGVQGELEQGDGQHRHAPKGATQASNEPGASAIQLPSPSWAAPSANSQMRSSASEVAREPLG